MLAGTTVRDPATTWIDVEVTLEPDTVLEPNVLLRGSTHVATGATVGPELPSSPTPWSVPARASPTRRPTAP